jgi:hypothetical protein
MAISPLFARAASEQENQAAIQSTRARIVLPMPLR